MGQGLEQGGYGRTEAPWCSHVEAFSTATCALYVGIVEDKFTGQLRLHKVHLSSQKGQLSLLRYEHPHACKRVTVERSLLPSSSNLGVNTQPECYVANCEKALKLHKKNCFIKATMCRNWTFPSLARPRGSIKKGCCGRTQSMLWIILKKGYLMLFFLSPCLHIPNIQIIFTTRKSTEIRHSLPSCSTSSSDVSLSLV